MSDSTVTPVNPEQIKGNWGETRDKLKVKFPTLTDSDLRFEKGKKHEMLAQVQVKLGKTKEELDTIIAEL
jgi:uncharacterized protein YjbJ (UPF0337 family)